MAPDAETARLMQALERFSERTKGGDVPPAVSEAIAGVQKALGGPTKAPASPGARAAYGGTGVPFNQAAKGPDRPSPGQREAMGVSDDIRERAAAIIKQAR